MHSFLKVRKRDRQKGVADNNKKMKKENFFLLSTFPFRYNTGVYDCTVHFYV